MFFDQIVMKISRMNYSHEMAFVQKEFFYDFLLKNPHIVLKHRQWFENYEESLMPSANDLIQLKKWQLATLLRGHSVVEQRFVWQCVFCVFFPKENYFFTVISQRIFLNWTEKLLILYFELDRSEMTSSVPTSQIETRKKGKSRLSPSKQVQANDNGQNSDSARLYEPGDIVWAKLGHFAWWPAIIVSQNQIQLFS